MNIKFGGTFWLYQKDLPPAFRLDSSLANVQSSIDEFTGSNGESGWKITVPNEKDTTVATSFFDNNITAFYYQKNLTDSIKIGLNSRLSLSKEDLRPFRINDRNNTAIPWYIAKRAHDGYKKKYPETDQPIEIVHQRGGFALYELDNFYPAWKEELKQFFQQYPSWQPIEWAKVNFEKSLQPYKPDKS